MDKLSAEQQAKVKKMSDFRIRAQLMQAGADEAAVLALTREQLLEAMAQQLLSSKPAAVANPVAPSGNLSPEQFQAWLEVERDKIAVEQAKMDADVELKRAEIDLKRMKLESEEHDRKLEQAKLEADVELKRAEIELKRIKMESEEHDRRLEQQHREILRAREDTLVSRTKRFVSAMKDVLGNFPSEPVDIPGYFEHIENLFLSFKVPDDVKATLLQCKLHDKAKLLIARLAREQLDDYEQLKTFLLNEYRVSALKLRERFYTLCKQADETYTLLESRLRNAYMYYIQRRGGIDTVEQLVDLICADRLKELVPRSCLDFLLTQEKESWLGARELALAADTYMSCHYADGNPRVGVTPNPAKNRFNFDKHKSTLENKTCKSEAA